MLADLLRMSDSPRAALEPLQAACKLAPTPEQKRALSVRLLALLSEVRSPYISLYLPISPYISPISP